MVWDAAVEILGTVTDFVGQRTGLVKDATDEEPISRDALDAAAKAISKTIEQTYQGLPPLGGCCP